MTFQLPSLPFPLNSLEPHLSAAALELHHAKHHRNYVETLNSLVEEQGLSGLSLEQLIQTQQGPVFENAAQAWNHECYWNSMTPQPMPGIDGSPLERAIRRDFGEFEALRARFKESALSVFGSGWAWLVQGQGGRLEVLTTKDADCPLRTGMQPLIACDVWEHAYYLDYQNKRNSYIDAWWEIVNWAFAEQNFRQEIAATPSERVIDRSDRLAAAPRGR